MFLHVMKADRSKRNTRQNKHPPNVRIPFHSGFRTENPCVAGSIPAPSTVWKWERPKRSIQARSASKGNPRSITQKSVPHSLAGASGLHGQWSLSADPGKMPASLFLVAGTFFSAAERLHGMAAFAQHVGERILLAC